MAGLFITPSGVQKITEEIVSQEQNCNIVITRDTQNIINILTNDWASPRSKVFSLEVGKSLASMYQAVYDATYRIVEYINVVIDQYNMQEGSTIGHIYSKTIPLTETALDTGTPETLPDGESVGISDNTSIERVFTLLDKNYSDIASTYNMYLDAIVGVIKKSGAFDDITITQCIYIARTYKESITAELEVCKTACKHRIDHESSVRTATRDSRNGDGPKGIQK